MMRTLKGYYFQGLPIERKDIMVFKLVNSEVKVA